MTSLIKLILKVLWIETKFFVSAKNFLNEYFIWLNQLVSVFNRMAPGVTNYGKALVDIGHANPITKQFTVKMKKINKMYQSTAGNMAYLSRVLQLYFSEFATTARGMLNAM